MLAFRFCRRKGVRRYFLHLLAALPFGTVGCVAKAANLTMTFSGTAIQGSIDTYGLFGPPGADLSNQTVSFTITWNPDESGHGILPPGSIVNSVSINGATQTVSNYYDPRNGAMSAWSYGSTGSPFYMIPASINDGPDPKTFEELQIGYIPSYPPKGKKINLNNPTLPAPSLYGVYFGWTKSTDSGQENEYISATFTSAQMIFNGMNIAGGAGEPGFGGNPPGLAVAGQQVNVNAVISPILGTQVSGGWVSLTDPAPIGGYTPTAINYQTGEKLPWVTTNNSTTLYFTGPTGLPFYNGIEYDYTLSNGFTGRIPGFFSVTPAPRPSVNPYEKSAAVACNANGTNYCDIELLTIGGNNGLYMGFGNPASGSTNTGFLASTSTSPGAGMFQWVQLIDSDRVSIKTTAGDTVVCKGTAGLDSTYPYIVGSNTADDPAVQLSSSFASVSREFSAQTYLMWTSNIAGSIPVPLGSVTWAFEESSLADANAPFKGWDTPTITSNLGQFVIDDSDYPIWKEISTKKGKCNIVQGAVP